MNVYKGRLLKKSSNRKLKLVQSTWLSNIAFCLRPIWLQTLVAIDSESRKTSFPSFCVQLSEVAVLFDALKLLQSSRWALSNQSAWRFRPNSTPLHRAWSAGVSVNSSITSRTESQSAGASVRFYLLYSHQPHLCHFPKFSCLILSQNNLILDGRTLDGWMKIYCYWCFLQRQQWLTGLLAAWCALADMAVFQGLIQATKSPALLPPRVQRVG